MAARASSASPNRQGQEEQLGALGLIVNTIVLYNTIYTQRALDHIAATTRSEPRDGNIERLSPWAVTTAPSPAPTASCSRRHYTTAAPTAPSTHHSRPKTIV